MGRPKRELDADIKKEMESIATQFKRFRTDNKLTQKFLAEVVEISRRTIQQIESGKIIPQAATLEKFEKLRSKYEVNGKPTGKRKSKKIKE